MLVSLGMIVTTSMSMTTTTTNTTTIATTSASGNINLSFKHTYVRSKRTVVNQYINGKINQT